MLATVVEGFEKRVGSLQEQEADLHKAVELLLLKGGIDVYGSGEERTEREETVVVVPGPSSQQSVKDKRKELALAGGLGFAIGAGILAAMGALRS